VSTILNVGISGAGTIGRVHADALRNIPSARLVAFAEPRSDAAGAFAADYGATHYESFVDMLQHDGLDVVIIATPSGIHPDQAVLAAEAGKHIITEKPMAITREGLDRMIEAADEAQVHLAVIFQNRLSPDVFRVKRALDRGVFGTPVLANGAMYWHRTAEYYAASGGWRGTWSLDGGGALMNQAIHTVDLLQWLMGGVADVRAHVATRVHEIETEDTAAVSFQFNNGALGTLTATTAASQDWPVRIEIVGSAGRVTLENNAVTLWEAPIGPDAIILEDDDLELVGGWLPGEPFGAAHGRQLRHIFNTMAADRDPYLLGREARAAVDCILAVYENAR
jgi:UDP-N-acetyl-2-amino-2-deoxyglucuronate dehydrogenase